MLNNEEIVDETFVKKFIDDVNTYSDSVENFKKTFQEIDNQRIKLTEMLKKIEDSGLLDPETKNKLLKLKI
jgi:hypothetical protein